jgi:peptidoglycan-associated lipoprotein
MPAPAPSLFPGTAGSRTPGSTSGSTKAEVPPPPPMIPVDNPVSVGGNDPFSSVSVVDINKDSPLKAVFFAYDSDTLDDTARTTMSNNASVLKQYGTWIVTVEGHCDERGTAEYNLALGDRRALVVKNYMVSLGVAADRMRTVSYGSEFPFVPGHDEKSWSLNRRAHFMLTAKQ